ncbi:MAG TPA: zinc-binding dehydrogenase [Chitinophagales bacterium]|nr:zinc-binding dehydrogenase [Chitinophagales bacterium]
MKAAVLVQHGEAATAFRLQEHPIPTHQADEVLIAVDAFGLNFADVMAMRGKYQDCPPLPAVVGYEVVGRVMAIGSEVTHLVVGQRVVAFTRFGAYATEVVTKGKAVVAIPDHFSNGVAAALATQYCTAYYAAAYLLQLRPGEKVLIHAAAGGVGTALVQLAKWRGCTIFGTASGCEKIHYLLQQGVDFPIDYSQRNFVEAIQTLSSNGKVDVIFDSIGGNSVRKGMELLQAGGKMVCYGAAVLAQTPTISVKMLSEGLGFGLYHPAQLMMRSIALLGVNMLRIADEQPDVLQHCLENCVRLAEEGVFRPTVGGVFHYQDLPAAIALLENRQSIGKIVVEW